MRKKVMCCLMVSIFCLYGLGILSSCKGFGSSVSFCDNEYFIYWANYARNDIRIVGLTDMGREQEYLVIPEMIDDMKVTRIGCLTGDVSTIEEKYGDEKYAQFKSEKLRKIFILPNVEFVDGWCTGVIVEKAPPFEAIFYISNQERQGYTPEIFFFSTSLNGETNLKSWDRQLENPYLCNYAANVSYYYNYENSPNEGYYWIDNYEYGDTIEYIPEPPFREGYRFGGWYKESKCINAWDFEVDTLPEIQYNEEGIRIYQETKLYAKWI